MGVELTGKTLGVIGCGNIGSIVADRAIGLKMQVIAFDPFLSPERALELGVEKVELDELLAPRRLHHPAHAADRRRPRTSSRPRTSPRPRRACASSTAPAAAWSTRRRCAAALEVRPCRRRRPSTCSSRSRPRQNPLFGHAQRRLHAASRRRDHARRRRTWRCRWPSRCPTTCCTGAISNAINIPSITAEEAPRLKPFVALAEKLGSFAGQLTEAPHQGHPHRVRGRGRRR